MTQFGRELGSKLSVASFGWTKPAILMAVMAAAAEAKKNGVEEQPIFLARFSGLANGLKPYKNTYRKNDSDAETLFGLVGSFEGTGSSPDNGETKTLSGTILYLPSYVQAMIEGAMSMEDVGGVSIGYDVYAKVNPRDEAAYTFIVADLLNNPNPVIEEVKASLANIPLPSSTKALEAPKSAK